MTSSPLNKYYLFLLSFWFLFLGSPPTLAEDHFLERHFDEACASELVDDGANGLEGQFEFIWYPKSSRFSVSHVEFSLDGKMWNPIFGYSVSRTMDHAITAARSGRRGFFRFKLNATPEGLTELRKFLLARKDKLALQTCVTGTCQALGIAGVRVPMGVSLDPMLTVGFLFLAKELGDPRIQEMEYVGSSRMRSLAAPHLAIEVILIVALTQLRGTDIINLMQRALEALQIMMNIQ